MSSFVVCTGNRSKPILPRCVPHLHAHLSIINFYVFHFLSRISVYKVDADGIVKGGREIVFDISHEHARLPNARVADDQDLQKPLAKLSTAYFSCLLYCMFVFLSESVINVFKLFVERNIIPFAMLWADLMCEWMGWAPFIQWWLRRLHFFPHGLHKIWLYVLYALRINHSLSLGGSLTLFKGIIFCFPGLLWNSICCSQMLINTPQLGLNFNRYCLPC